VRAWKERINEWVWCCWWGRRFEEAVKGETVSIVRSRRPHTCYTVGEEKGRAAEAPARALDFL